MQKNVKKGQSIWNVGQKCTKFENTLKKGRWLRTIIARNKLLEKALSEHIICFSNWAHRDRLLTKVHLALVPIHPKFNFFILLNTKSNKKSIENLYVSFASARDTLSCFFDIPSQFVCKSHSLDNFMLILNEPIDVIVALEEIISQWSRFFNSYMFWNGSLLLATSLKTQGVLIYDFKWLYLIECVIYPILSIPDFYFVHNFKCFFIAFLDQPLRHGHG